MLKMSDIEKNATVKDSIFDRSLTVLSFR
jgi:hypothetical protein